MSYDRILDCVSWDSGYGGDKIYSEVGSEKDVNMMKLYNSIIFPSIETELPTSILENTQMPRTFTKETLKNELTIKYQGKKYAIGKHALIIDPNINPSYSEKKFQRPTEILRFLAGLTYLNPEFDRICIKELAVGLSLSTYSKYFEELQAMYADKEYDFEVLTTNGTIKHKYVKIENCTALPQCQGSFFHKFFAILPSGKVGSNINSQQLLQRRVGIIDIGAYTTDSMIHQGLKPIPGTEIVFEYGISEAFNIVSNALNGMPPKKIEDAYLEYVDPNNLHKRYAVTWKQQEYPLAKIGEKCEAAFETIAQKIAEKITEKWKGQMDHLDLILLCGGGAICIIEYIIKYLPNTIELVENPQFSNVFGWMNRQLFMQQMTKTVSYVRV